MYDVKGERRSSAPPSVVYGAICEALRKHRFQTQQIGEATIKYSMPFGLGQSHLLVFGSGGFITVEAEETGSRVSYCVSLLWPRTFALVVTLVNVLLRYVPMVLILAWGAYGIGHLFSRIGMARFVDRVTKGLPQAGAGGEGTSQDSSSGELHRGEISPSHQTTDARTKTPVSAIGCYVVSILVLGALIRWPYSVAEHELLLWCFGAIAMAAHLFWALYVGNCIYGKTRPFPQIKYVASSVLLVAFIMLSLFFRIQGFLILADEFDGVITEIPVSSGHAHRSIRIRTPEGKLRTIGNVYFPTWEKLAQGDRIRKDSYSPYGQLNGVEVVFVDPMWWRGRKARNLEKLSAVDKTAPNP